MTRLLSIAETAALIRTGQTSPRQLVEQSIAAIERYDSRVHAWVAIDAEGALRTADALTREMKSGTTRGPLHGIPVGIKDIFDVAGMPTRAGSPVTDDHPAKKDAPLVMALRQAGAIILGKTVTVEFACFDPSPTRNPWDPELKHTPGGSSSGSAAALAAGMCYAALGTQTGGSLVRPASYCGISTIKPTFGLLSREGVFPVSYSLDHPGPMARKVGDLRILMQSLTGDSSFKSDAITLPPRLGLMEHFFMDEAHPAVRRAIEDVVAKFRNAGAYIVPVRCEIDFNEVATMHRRIMAVEAAEHHRAKFATHRDQYGPKITTLLDEGLKILGVDYVNALAWQRDFGRRVGEIFSQCDALITPSTDTTAPATLETTGTPKFQAPWSCAGVPAVSIPCALAADKMPVGLQLVGRHKQDAALLNAAAWCERVIGFDKRPAMVCD